MAQELTPALFANAVKRYYPQRELRDLTKRKNWFYNNVKKDTNAAMQGDFIHVAMRFSEATGGGHNFAKALANAAPGSIARWLLTTADVYQLVSISRKVIKTAASSQGALENVFKKMDLAIEAANNIVAQGLFRTTAGSIGVISAINGATATLTRQGDVANFRKDMTVQVVTDAAGSAFRDSGEELVVASVDFSASTVTFTTSITADVSGTIAGDHLIRSGSCGAGTSPTPAAIAGLASWLPDVAPSATPFFSQDRSLDATLLGGHRIDGSSGQLDAKLIEAATQIQMFEGEPSHLICNPLKLATLSNLLADQKMRTSAKDGTMGFDGFSVLTPAGEVEVVGDVNCPQDRMYMIELPSWTLYSTGPTLSIFEEDSTWLRESASDAYQVRVGGYMQLSSDAPGHNAVILL